MQPNQVSYNPTTPIQNLLPVFSSGQTHQQCQTFGRMNGMDVVAIQVGKSLLSTMRPTQEPWKSGYPQYHQAKTELLQLNYAKQQDNSQVADPRPEQQAISGSVASEINAEESKPFQCDWCQRRATSHSAIKQHFRRHHPELPLDQRLYTNTSISHNQGSYT